MILIFIGRTLVPRTAANIILWQLYIAPHRPLPVADMLGVKRTAAIMRLQRAADSIGQYSPRLAVALRNHVHWEGGVATYKPRR